MADPINVSNLRTALSGVSSYPLLVRTPRMVGYHKIVKVSAASVISDALFPAGSSGTDDWFMLTLEPLVASGSSAGSFIGRPSTALPDLAGVMTGTELLPLMESLYNSHKVAVADTNGVFICNAPVRISVTTEYGATNKSAVVLQLF